MRQAVFLIVFVLTSTLGWAQTLPPGTALPPPGAVRPPSLNKEWRPVEGPPTLPKSAPLIFTPQNQFLLPASPPKISCAREHDFIVCNVYSDQGLAK
jgi:hypothetical protein